MPPEKRLWKLYRQSTVRRRKRYCASFRGGEAVGSKSPDVQECVEGYLFCGRPARLLLFRRPRARGGFWVPVSGKVEPTDADFTSCLRREVTEESGLTNFRRIFSLDWEVSFEGPDGRTWRLHAFGVELKEEVSPVLSLEHDAYEWVGFADALARLHFPDNREAVKRLVDLIDSSPATPSTS